MTTLPPAQLKRLFIAAVAAVLILAAILALGVYALHRRGAARNAENQARTAGNVRRIIMACRTYAADNLNYFPPHLAAAVPYGVTPELLVDRATGTTPMPPADTVDLTDWQRLAPAVDAHTDFLYTGQRVRATDPADIIVLVSKPAVASNGRLLGFVDGRVDFVFTAELPDVLAKDAAGRTANRRPALPALP